MNCSQNVIQKHFTDMLAGKTACSECVCVFVPEKKIYILEFVSYTNLCYHFLCLSLSIVLLPVSHAESTPSILEVDFFNLLVSIEKNMHFIVVIVNMNTWTSPL